MITEGEGSRSFQGTSHPTPHGGLHRCSDVVHHMLQRIALVSEPPDVAVGATTTATRAPSAAGVMCATSESPSLLTGPELQTLLYHCYHTSNDTNNGGTTATATGHDEGFAAVEDGELRSLVRALEQRVVAASRARILESAVQMLRHHQRDLGSSPTQVATALNQWLMHHGMAQLTTLQRGLEAAQVVLVLAAMPPPPLHPHRRNLVDEEAVAAAVALARSHLSKHLVPSLNLTAHLLLTAETAVQPRTPSVKRSPGPLSNAAVSKRRSTGSGIAVAVPDTPSTTDGFDHEVTARELTKVYRALLTGTLDAHLAVLDRLHAALDSPTCAFDDQHILMITGAMITTLELDATAFSSSPVAVQRLQHAAIAIITVIFRRYPAHRATLLLDDLVATLSKLPPHKKAVLLRTYPVSYASVEHGQRLAAWNRELLVRPSSSGGTTALFGPRGQHSVQALAALLVSLVLVSVERPRYVAREPDKDEGAAPPSTRDTDPTSQTDQYQSGLAACQYWADAFCAKLVLRCTGKQGAFDYRVLLSCLVDDWLSLWLIPEYAAAEVWLVSALRRLKHDILLSSPSYAAAHNRSPPSKATIDSSYLNVAFDLVGRMVVAQARTLAEGRHQPLRPTPRSLLPTAKLPGGARTASANDLELPCCCRDSTSTNRFLVRCDFCSRVSHGACVGISRDRVPEVWNCDGCKLAQNMMHVRSQLGLYEHQLQEWESVLDDAYALQHSYVSHIAHREGLVRVREITRFHLARWTDRLATAPSHPPSATAAATATARTQTLIMRLLDHWEGPGGPASQLLSEEGAIRLIASTMGLTSTFLTCFPAQLNTMLRLLGDDVHALRKLSLKTIEKIVEADPDLMSQKIIIRAVSRRLSDDQISVREAALSLVGAYITKSPDVASSFQKSVLACLTDEGVSVRKRCVRIFQNLLAADPCFLGRTAVCSSLVQRAADPKEEDGVRDLIHELFLQLWLQDGEKVVASSAAADAVSAPPSSPSMVQLGPTKRLNTRADAAAMQMVEVVRACKSAVELETLIRELLHGAEDNDKGRKQSERNKRASLARSKCDLLVTALFELLVSIPERESTSTGCLANDLAATLQTICVFADLAPIAVLRRLDTILPYLKADNGVSTSDEQVIVTATCNIIHRLTLSCGPETASRSASVAGDLADIAYKCGSAAVEASIRALSSLSNHQQAVRKGDFDVELQHISQKFYGYLANKSKTQDFADVKVRHNVHRALAALGFVCEYCETKCDSNTWEEEVLSGSMDLVARKDFTLENGLLPCYRVFRIYLGKSDVPTKCAALRALAGMFVSQPRLMLVLEQDDLIDELMSDTADHSLQLASLKCWRRILLGEEKRIDGGLAQAKMDSDGKITTAKRISGDQDGDSSLFGGILTNHATRLFALTQSSNASIRLASLELIGVLLKQGQVNPNDAVPFLFALQGDSESTDISALSLSLLMAEGEKRPDMLRQRICSGVKKAFTFQRSMYPTKPVSALKAVQRPDAATQECIFALVFKECVARIRKQRHGMYSNLLALFALPDLEDEASPTRKSREMAPESTPKPILDIELLSFVAQILAHLPYEAAGDPLFIIHKITSIVWLQGSQLMDRISSLLRPIGLASSDEMDDSNAAEDALERAARAKFPSRTQEAKSLLSPEFDLNTFIDLCWMGGALTLQLRLKSFLRQLYNLSEVRCLSFDPDAKESTADRGVSKSTTPMTFNAAIDSDDLSTVRAAGGGLADMDRLLRKYAELRRLLREEIAVNSDDAGRERESDAGPCVSPLRTAGGGDHDPPPQAAPVTRSASFRCSSLLA